MAEAAKACGSSLHLYRNPFEDKESEDEEEFEGDKNDVNNESSSDNECKSLTKNDWLLYKIQIFLKYNDFYWKFFFSWNFSPFFHIFFFTKLQQSRKS